MRKEEWECILELIDCRLADEAAEYMSKHTKRMIAFGIHIDLNRTRKRRYFRRISIGFLALVLFMLGCAGAVL